MSRLLTAVDRAERHSDCAFCFLAFAARRLGTCKTKQKSKAETKRKRRFMTIRVHAHGYFNLCHCAYVTATNTVPCARSNTVCRIDVCQRGTTRCPFSSGLITHQAKGYTSANRINDSIIFAKQQSESSSAFNRSSRCCQAGTFRARFKSCVATICYSVHESRCKRAAYSIRMKCRSLI